MRNYGLPMGVVAGLVLAAALGAVAGARWATRRGSGASVSGGVEVEEAPAARPETPGRLALPRFITPGAEPAPDEPRTATPHRRSGRAASVATAAAPAGPRPEMGAEGPAPSPTAIARAREVRTALESAVAAHPGTRVRFADCSTGTCVASVESSQAAPIDQLLRDRQRLPAGFTARAHERLTAFNGRLWELELVEEKP
jgi:hypothetical protein